MLELASVSFYFKDFYECALSKAFACSLNRASIQIRSSNSAGRNNESVEVG